MLPENLPAEPVLVTGANGFIGRRVVERLLEGNLDVRAFVLPGEKTPPSWENRVSVISGNLKDRESVRAASRDAGTLIHLAALVSDWGDEKLFWEYTVEGSRSIFDAALENRTRVVLASSIVYYGDRIRRQACPEETPCGRPLGPYSRTKQAQENLAWSYHREKGMRLSVVRPANVYGPQAGTWLRDLLEVLKNGAPGLISGGHGNAGLVYVDNVADLLLLAASSDQALGQAYNACDGLDVTWRRYVSDLALMAGLRPPLSLPAPLAELAARTGESIWKMLRIRKRPPLTREALNLVAADHRIPGDKARRELGHRPRVSYAQGMENIRLFLKTIQN